MIRVGTCSWQEKTLIQQGGFYPIGMAESEMISYYAEEFDVVEVDSSYYRFISKETFKKWTERTPDGFLFNVKVPGIFTLQGIPADGLPSDIFKELPEETRKKGRLYDRDLPAEVNEELWARCSDSIEPLRESAKLGSLLFQFPGYFRPGTKSPAYLAYIKEKLPRDIIAVEFRHSSWFRDPETGEDRTEQTLQFLEENGFAYVAVDEPQGLSSSVPPIFAATHPRYAIVRFHGRKVKTWEQNVKPSEKFDWYYSDEELAPWIPPIMGASGEGREVHAMVNTNNGNQGPVNSLRIKKNLGQISEEEYQQRVAAMHASMRERAVREAGRTARAR